MAKKHKTTRVVPRAGRLINSLRDLGYETPEAVADLIDNSITAGAKNVDITVHFDGGDSWIRIVDDGHGMDGATITEAMRYGSERDYDDDDLGKFGLGLKTASMSQCRKLTVASRTSASTARIETRQLDLDFVEATNDWDIIILGAQGRPKHVEQPLTRHRGTVVLWEDLDRILTYQDPAGGWAKRQMLDLAERIEQHVAMVFHRFLAGEVRGRKLTITINGAEVVPWDPFARGESETKTLKAEDFPLSTPYGSGVVRMMPFVLPPKASFSSTAAWERAGGPRKWNPQQGFYIYRADRLIQSGGWSRTRVVDEHTKLSRIALMFSPALDHAFEINVAKMRVSLPAELKELIKGSVDTAVREARTIYDAKPDAHAGRGAKGGGHTTGGNGTSAGGGTGTGATGGAGGNGSGAGSNGSGTGGGVGTVTLPGTRRDALEKAAQAAKEARALRKIVKKLEDRSPEIARDLGW